MNSLSDLNRISGQPMRVTDNRTASIVYTAASATNDSQLANKFSYLKYQPAFGFSSITNAANAYLDFDYTGGYIGSTESDTDILTSGYSYTIKLYIPTALSPTVAQLQSLQKAVSWAGQRPSIFGTPRRLTGIGSGSMYCMWNYSELDPSYFTPIAYDFTVFGIKSMWDWNLIKNPVIYIASPVNQLYLDTTLTTAYRTDTWRTTFSVNSSLDDGATAASDYADAGYDYLLNFAVERQVFANIANQFIFDRYIPKINYDDGATYFVNVAVTGGNVGSNTNPTSNTVSITGTIAATNTLLRTVRFTPDTGVAGTRTVTIDVNKNGSSIITRTADVVIVGNTEPLGNTYVITTAGTTTFTPTAEERLQRCDIVTIAGGQGGERKATTPGSGVGGQAGQVVANVGLTLTDTSYTISIGAGGSTTSNTAQSGANTTITGNTVGVVVRALAGGRFTANTAGNLSAGGIWGHASGTSSTYGGGGGGAGSAGRDGTTGAAGLGGNAVTRGDFYLIGRVTSAGAGGGLNTSYSYPGSGGAGQTSSGTRPAAGAAGAVIIRFY